MTPKRSIIHCEPEKTLKNMETAPYHEYESKIFETIEQL